MIRAIRRFFFNRDGATTTEFAVAFPFFMWILFMFTEIGVLTLRTAMLKRGLSIATRDVRVGDPAVLTLSGFRTSVCNNAFFLQDCADSLLIEMTKIENANLATFNCVNRADETLTPATTFNPGKPDEIMLVRACILVKPVFPGAGIGADLARQLNGEYAIVATSAFMNEPN